MVQLVVRLHNNAQYTMHGVRVIGKHGSTIQMVLPYKLSLVEHRAVVHFTPRHSCGDRGIG